MGLHPKWGPSVKDIVLDMNDKWVAVEMKDMTLIAVYALGPQAQRYKIWESIRKEYDEPVILIGDFNMVELYEDRYKKLGQVISGTEKREWNNLKNQLNLIDVGVVGEYTWQNSDSMNAWP